MKKVKIGLLGKILIAIALGIGLGLIVPGWLVRIFLTFNGIFSQFLGFAIPLIIVGLVTPAISDIGKTAGKMLLVTVAIAYGSTVFAGLVSYLTGAALFPGMIDQSAMQQVETAAELSPYFTVTIPPFMNVMTALVLAFTLGLGLASLGKTTLNDAVHDFEKIIVKTIKTAIIPLLPIYIFGIFLNMTFVGQVFSILTVFIKIIGIIFLIHIGILILQFCIAGGFARKNPFKMLWNMLPAYFTALGTQSSAATIPVTLEQTRKNGVSEDIAGFTIPLCSTIHMSGSTLKIVACALALMIMQGMPYDFGLFAGFICMLGITMVAAPGVPGGAIMASLGLLQSMLGFNQEAQALMIALYIAMDSFGTACNVTGDGAIAVVIEKLMGKKA
ncbi:MAG: dicarboxylate/amino acid:cation symporter [Bacteroidales bacterium]|nr:dicarboxylate/amino acid:cation symporter [Bacteroidales bacterium]MBR0321308.1 dicarboxylate/amino acid:cation symporter [Bacteroidales bacterium]MBR5810200.1 dicarboxylate/amino acid:cation symporter [Bacteroidales bacterium]